MDDRPADHQWIIDELFGGDDEAFLAASRNNQITRISFGRTESLSAQQCATYLRELSYGKSKMKAAAAAGAHWTSFFFLAKELPAFAEAVKQAEEMRRNWRVEVAHEQATEGVPVKKYYKGELAEESTFYPTNQLLQFLIKYPMEYRPRAPDGKMLPWAQDDEEPDVIESSSVPPRIRGGVESAAEKDREKLRKMLADRVQQRKQDDA